MSATTVATTQQADRAAAAANLYQLTGIPEEVLLTEKPYLPSHDFDFRSTLFTLWTMYSKCEALMSCGWFGSAQEQVDSAISSNRAAILAIVEETGNMVNETQRRFFLSERRAWRLLREARWEIEAVSSQIKLNKTYPLADHPHVRQVYMSFFNSEELSIMRCSNQAVSKAVDHYIEEQCVEHVTYLMQDYGANDAKGSIGPGANTLKMRAFKPDAVKKDARLGPGDGKTTIVEIEDPKFGDKQVKHHHPKNSGQLQEHLNGGVFNNWSPIVNDTDGKLSVGMGTHISQYSFMVRIPKDAECNGGGFGGLGSRCCVTCGIRMSELRTSYGDYGGFFNKQDEDFLCRACGVKILKTKFDIDVRFLRSFQDDDDEDELKRRTNAASSSSPTAGGGGESTAFDFTELQKIEPAVNFQDGQRYLKLLQGMRQYHRSFTVELFRRLNLNPALLEVNLFDPVDGNRSPLQFKALEQGYCLTEQMNTVALKLPWKAAAEVYQESSYFRFFNVILDFCGEGDSGQPPQASYDDTDLTSCPPFGCHTTLILANWYAKVDGSTLRTAQVNIPSVAAEGEDSNNNRNRGGGGGFGGGGGGGFGRGSSFSDQFGQRIRYIKVLQLENAPHSITDFGTGPIVGGVAGVNGPQHRPENQHSFHNLPRELFVVLDISSLSDVVTIDVECASIVLEDIASSIAAKSKKKVPAIKAYSHPGPNGMMTRQFTRFALVEVLRSILAFDLSVEGVDDDNNGSGVDNIDGLLDEHEPMPRLFNSLTVLPELPEYFASDCRSPHKLQTLQHMAALKTIKVSCFSGFASLVEMDLSAPKLEEIEDNVLSSCSTLRIISLVGARSLKKIGNKFASKCRNLSKIILPTTTTAAGGGNGGDEIALVSVGDGFLSECPSLQVVENLSTAFSKVTVLGHWFSISAPLHSRLEQLDLTGCTRINRISADFPEGWEAKYRRQGTTFLPSPEIKLQLDAFDKNNKSKRDLAGPEKASEEKNLPSGGGGGFGFGGGNNGGGW